MIGLCPQVNAVLTPHLPLDSSLLCTSKNNTWIAPMGFTKTFEDGSTPSIAIIGAG